nr:hypothetical protein [uncultured Halomonas sp.]
MFNLIVTVMSIALMGMLAAASMSYINPEAMRAVEWQKRLETTFNDLEAGYDRYRLAGTTHLRFQNVDGDGNVTEYWYEEAFSPVEPISAYVTPPVMPGATSWDFDSASGGTYFCLHGEFPREAARAAGNLLNLYGPQYVVSASCGATASSSPAGLATMAITYWVDPPS